MEQEAQSDGRVNREVRTHDEDLTKPVKASKIMATDREIHGESCFSHLWDMETWKCQVCADTEMCGILFHKRLKKQVKAIDEAGPAPMDTAGFENINKDDLIIWLGITPRRTGEFVAKVNQMVKCDDPDTVRAWAVSFIKDHPRLSVKKPYIIVN